MKHLSNSKRHSDASRKRGFVLVLLILTLGVGALILTSVTSVTLRQGLSLDREQRFAQARQYALAALERTRLQLLSQPNFAGETWSIPAFQPGEESPATAAIQVLAVPDRADQRNVQIEVSFPSAIGTSWNYHSTQLLTLKFPSGTNP
ncbi:MAG: hypothetical protein U0903_09400 [Planctomycetales bacterium]